MRRRRALTGGSIFVKVVRASCFLRPASAVRVLIRVVDGWVLHCGRSRRVRKVEMQRPRGSAERRPLMNGPGENWSRVTIGSASYTGHELHESGQCQESQGCKPGCHVHCRGRGPPGSLKGTTIPIGKQAGKGKFRRTTQMGQTAPSTRASKCRPCWRGVRGKTGRQSLAWGITVLYDP